MKTMMRHRKLWSTLMLGIMGSFVVLSMALPLVSHIAQAQEAQSAAAAAPVEMGKDVYYKTDGPVSGSGWPEMTEKNYTSYSSLPFPLSENRVIIWVLAQQHLYFGSFVLAVPIFCMVIELIGMLVRDKAMAKKYDHLAYTFVKISLTAYSVTATGEPRRVPILCPYAIGFDVHPLRAVK